MQDPIDGEVCRLAFPDVADAPPIRIAYGLNFETALAKHLPDYNATRVFALVSKGLNKSSGTRLILSRALGRKLVGWSIGGVSPHTPWADLIDIVNQVRAKSCDAILTVGGSSLADAAKCISYALANDVRSYEEMEALVRKHEFHQTLTDVPEIIGLPAELPILCVPTTLSGAEYTTICTGTNYRTRQKTTLWHPSLYPALVVLDPVLSLSTPDWVWRSTGMLVASHCVEGLCSNEGTASSDAAIGRALTQLIKAMLHHCDDESDTVSRLRSQLALVDAMAGPVAGVTFGACHGIGNQLGPFGVGHGQTSCILLPGVLKFNARDADQREKQDAIKRSLWEDDKIAWYLNRSGLDVDQSDAGDALGAIFDVLGARKNLKQFGILPDRYDHIVRNALRDPCCRQNPVPLDEIGIKEILELCSGE